MSDEDKMIKKLEEHRDTIKLVLEIAELKGIDVKPTEGNDSKGDFIYRLDQKKELIEALDEYIGHHKYKKKED